MQTIKLPHESGEEPQAVIHAHRNQHKFALFFVDLDRFKNVNDSIGHSAGDQVLLCIGERMKALVRSSDTVARLGGDEFVLILQESNSDHAMELLAKKIITHINQPIPYGHHQCNVGASIGIACYPRHGYKPEQLVKCADMAMYEAKNNGRNRVQFFNQDLHDKQGRFFFLENELREALNSPNESFKLHYQPRVELKSNKICAYEALIRWQHKTLGNIPPDQFIPLAESLGLIERIDEWVFGQACQQILTAKIYKTDLRISINISGHSFNQHNFISSMIEPILKKYGIDGNNLEIEITEGVLLKDTQYLYRCMETIKRMGIHLAIDDFGTGFSSLSYLNTFPINTLKIDGSFICDSSSSDSQKSLLKAILALGDALEMKVVVEGIETLGQIDYLIKLNCDEGQGYYLGKPGAEWFNPEDE